MAVSRSSSTWWSHLRAMKTTVSRGIEGARSYKSVWSTGGLQLLVSALTTSTVAGFPTWISAGTWCTGGWRQVTASVPVVVVVVVVVVAIGALLFLVAKHFFLVNAPRWAPPFPLPPRRRSDCLPLPNLGKKLFSSCNWAFTSLRAAHVQAFMKLFLKLSLKKAYSIGFIAELE